MNIYAALLISATLQEDAPRSATNCVRDNIDRATIAMNEMIRLGFMERRASAFFTTRLGRAVLGDPR